MAGRQSVEIITHNVPLDPQATQAIWLDPYAEFKGWGKKVTKWESFSNKKLERTCRFIFLKLHDCCSMW